LRADGGEPARGKPSGAGVSPTSAGRMAKGIAPASGATCPSGRRVHDRRRTAERAALSQTLALRLRTALAAREHLGHARRGERRRGHARRFERCTGDDGLFPIAVRAAQQRRPGTNSTLAPQPARGVGLCHGNGGGVEARNCRQLGHLGRARPLRHTGRPHQRLRRDSGPADAVRSKGPWRSSPTPMYQPSACGRGGGWLNCGVRDAAIRCPRRHSEPEADALGRAAAGIVGRVEHGVGRFASARNG
jgi:hypothetical protein